MPFEFTPTAIPDCIYVRPRQFADARGYFCETYKRSDFLAAGIDVTFVQDNLSHSGTKVIRGLHFQRPPFAQGKLVQAVEGRVFDVAVDLRRGSPTFGHWVGQELDASRRDLLWIPPGFAHGFAVLSDYAVVSYKVTAEYNRDSEGGLVWNDPAFAIAWPLDAPLLSSRDAALPSFDPAVTPFDYQPRA